MVSSGLQVLENLPANPVLVAPGDQRVDEQVAAGTAVIAATHDERFIAQFATRVVRLDGGRVVADEVVA